MGIDEVDNEEDNLEFIGEIYILKEVCSIR